MKRPEHPVNVLAHVIIHALQQTPTNRATKTALRHVCKQQVPHEYTALRFAEACDRITHVGYAERFTAREAGTGAAVIQLHPRGIIARVWTPEP